MTATGRERPNLRRARERRGLSLAKAAAGIHQLAVTLCVRREVRVGPSHLWRWEMGEKDPEDFHVYLLCSFYGKAPAEIDLGKCWSWEIDPRYARLSMIDLLESTELASAMNFTSPSEDVPPAVRKSQEHWHEVRRFLAQRGSELVAGAGALYKNSTTIGTSASLTHPAWIMRHPIDLADMRLSLIAGLTLDSISGGEPEARLALPLHSPGHQFDRYSTAIRYLDRPRLFENRPSYQLMAINNGVEQGPSLDFTLSTYFEKVDVAETLAHEYAATYLARERRGMDPNPSWDDLPFRSLVDDPFDLQHRPVLPGIVTLTLRRSSASPPTMLLHVRNPAQVAIGGRVKTLLPSAEFQPASIALSSYSSDLDLWRNMVREYSEEVLGMPEHDGSHGATLDYDSWPLYRRLTAARRDGRLRVFFFGLACNPLSLGTDMMTVAVFDDSVFDTAFPSTSIRQTNSEGIIVGHEKAGVSTPAIGFDQDTVQRLLTRNELAPSSAACLDLAWQYRDAILAR